MLWTTALVVISIMVALDPTERTLLPLYHQAAFDWWARVDVYTDLHGMNYLPHFAVLFSPFHILGVPMGDIVWRVVSTAWLAYGLWQLLACFDRSRAGTLFFTATLFSIAMCLGAIRNGQANTIFAAATVQAAVSLIRGQWWRAAIFVALGVAIKPLGIVLLLLAPFVYRPLIPRLAAALVGLAAFPFLFGPPGYVIAQLRGFAGAMMMASNVTEDRFANVGGVLRALGLEYPGALSTAVSLAAAAVTLGVWWLARRTREPQRGVVLLSLATSYLMLFNPMNESNGYVIVAPAMAAVAIRLLERPHRAAGWVLVAIMLSIGILPELIRDLAPGFSLWSKPLLTVVYIGIVIWITMVRGIAARVPEPGGPTAQTAGSSPEP